MEGESVRIAREDTDTCDMAANSIGSRIAMV